MANANISIDIGQSEADKKQAMLAAIIDSSEDAIISKTLDGIITSWNQAAETMFGYTEEEALGKHISILIPTDRLSEEDMIIDNIRKGLRVQHFQTIRLKKDGNKIPISLTVSPIKSNGLIIGASKIARDISEQIRAEQDRARLYEEIKILNSRKDEFIGIAGHELRTPITTIKGYLQLLEDQPLDGLTKDFIEKALRQVNRLNRLITDLLDVTRIQAGKLEYNIEPCSLTDLVRESVETVWQIHTSHIIETRIPAEKGIIMADATKIEQVLINFLTNAIKYSPGAGKIFLTVTTEPVTAAEPALPPSDTAPRSPGRIIVSIRDTGIGIPPEHLQRIFDRYYRIDNTPHVIGGLGIGLYISREIIERHHGSIRVTSEPGQGSTFSFSLPLAE